MPFITSIDLNSTALGLDMYGEFVSGNINSPAVFLFTPNEDQILLVLLTFSLLYLHPHLSFSPSLYNFYFAQQFLFFFFVQSLL